MDANFFKEITKSLYLGNLIDNSIPVLGGITNKIYKVTTDKDKYVVKIINKDNIIKDNKLIEKIELSENIANKAKMAGISVVEALKFNNRYVNKYNDEYFLIYKWNDGEILLSKEITTKDLKLVASSIANLHKIKVMDKLEVIKYKKTDYQYYYNLLKDNNEKWAIFFKENFEKLHKLYEIVYKNYSNLSNQLSYVHKDLNRKNIIWNDNIPYIIDWETATIGNPGLDLFLAAWFLTEDVEENKYYTFTKEYLSIMDLEDDIETLAYAAIIEECNWLEFSLKRALKIHSSNKEEIELGKDSIISSLTEIINYYSKIDLMINIINKDL